MGLKAEVNIGTLLYYKIILKNYC